MTAATLLAEIEQVGGEIWTEGDRLKFRDTPARLVPAIREHKAALLALLSPPTTDATPAAGVQPERDMAPSRVSCGTCLRFLPGHPLLGQSLGRCSLTKAGPPSGGSGYKACYPLAPRQCPSYEHEDTEI